MKIDMSKVMVGQPYSPSGKGGDEVIPLTMELSFGPDDREAYSDILNRQTNRTKNRRLLDEALKYGLITKAHYTKRREADNMAPDVEIVKIEVRAGFGSNEDFWCDEQIVLEVGDGGVIDDLGLASPEYQQVFEAALQAVKNIQKVHLD